MYLTETRLLDVVKMQLSYKLKAYLSMFSSLLIIQIVGILLSTGGSRSMGTSTELFSLNISYYTGDISIIFTLIWSFISSIIITTKAYRNDDFIFVSTRLSSNLSNVAFLFVASLVGGITAALSGYLLKVVMFFILDNGHVIGSAIGFSEILLSMVVSVFYVFLFASLGYLVGMLAQISKWFGVLIPAVVVGYIILGTNMSGEPTIVLEIVKFFAQESQLWLFVVKVVFTTGLLFLFTSVVTNKLEVRQ